MRLLAKGPEVVKGTGLQVVDAVPVEAGEDEAGHGYDDKRGYSGTFDFCDHHGSEPKVIRTYEFIVVLCF